MPCTFRSKNKKYGIRKFDRIRSNVDYEKMGPLAVAFGDYIKILEAQERIVTSESYFSALKRRRKSLRYLKKTRRCLNSGARTHNSVFIKLWLDVTHPTLNRYFAFIAN